MHALLLAGLAWSTRWKSSTPVSVEAELWSSTAQSAAPAPTPALPPAPAPAPTPAPTPAPKPAPPAPVEKAEPAPDIALEKKREKEREQRERERDEQAKKQQTADKLKQQKLEQQAKDKKALAAREELELKESLRKEREEKLARLTTGAPGRGAAEANKGFSAGYEGRIAARIRPNITFSGDPTGNSTTVEIRLGSDGTVLGKRITKSSGNPAWDEAVSRAIDKTEQVPKDTDGRVPRSLELVFNPKER
jgi:colicin import membrane protein